MRLRGGGWALSWRGWGWWRMFLRCVFYVSSFFRLFICLFIYFEGGEFFSIWGRRSGRAGKRIPSDRGDFIKSLKKKRERERERERERGRKIELTRVPFSRP